MEKKKKCPYADQRASAQEIQHRVLFKLIFPSKHKTQSRAKRREYSEVKKEPPMKKEKDTRYNPKAC